jgi:hypothetical protein
MTYEFQSGPRPVLISARIRLNDQQRQTLKQAYYTQLDANAAPQGHRIGGSTVTTVTTTQHPLQKKFGQILVADLLGTRETIPLDTILTIQSCLGVEVITRDDILKACESYIEYNWAKQAGEVVNAAVS